MANIKIAQLTNQTAISDNDLIIVETATSTNKMTVGNFKELLGIPNGGIVESGSGVNGSYVKYADGTMMCWAIRTFSTTVELTWGSLFYHEVQSWTFPVAFVGDKPVCSAVCTDSAGELIGTVPNSTLTNMTFYGLRPTSIVTPTQFNFRVFAVGRWK